MDKKLISLTGLLIALILFISVNVVARATMRSVRLDLTENKLYSLSDGTRNILSDLSDPITLRFYFSRDLVENVAEIKSYGQRIRELLEEYAAYADGSLTLEYVEPELFSEEEDRAVGFGLSALRAGQSGERFFMGLAGTNTIDDEEIIAYFDPSREQFLEYDITQLVYNLGNPDRQVVGLLSGLPLRGASMDPRQPAQPWIIVQQLEQTFEVRHLEARAIEMIDEDVDVLVVVHPKEFPDSALFAIDQFVLGGGKAIVFVDPLCYHDQPLVPNQNPMQQNRSSDLPAILEAWGLELVSGKIVGDKGGALPVPAQDGRQVDFPAYFDVKEELSQDDLVTSELANVRLLMPGILRIRDGATTTIEPLMQTTPDSMEIDQFQVQFGLDPDRMLNSWIESGENFLLAARVTGPAQTAFPGGKPGSDLPDDTPEGEEGEDEGDEEPEPLMESTGPIHAIVVADADIVHEQMWTRVGNFLGNMLLSPFADNGDFVINAIDNLCGSTDLISLRSRGAYHRPFEKKRELEAAADEKFRAEEQRLQADLDEVELKLNELQEGKDAASALILSPEQQEELNNFREKQLETRKKLREVKHDLAKDIESLGTRLTLINILAVPALIVLAALAFFVLAPKRRSLA